ncbi:MAG: hypothetical protein R2703_13885 [Micropruina glycogenica]
MPDPITMLLVAAGVLTGIVGYGAGLASLVSFPALLAAGHATTDREPDQHGVAGRHHRRRWPRPRSRRASWSHSRARCSR